MINSYHNPALKQYVSELLKWNQGMNLIGKSTESAVWENHISDSLELIPFLKKDEIKTVIDIGSGGGLPAIPMAIEFSEKKFILTEVDSKKLAFLQFITKKLRLNSEVIDINKGFQFHEACIITSRAFSEIKNILEWAERHTPSVKSFYLLKGRSELVEKELSASERLLIKYTIPSIHTLPKGCIVEFHLK